MEFRLVYDGPLKAAASGRGGTRTEEKHAIRKVLHKQIKRLWEVVPQLKTRTEAYQAFWPGLNIRTGNVQTWAPPRATLRQSLVHSLGTSFERCGYKFVPLVNNTLKLSCGLEILFLRRDMPGTPLIHPGGDIDNRLKVLFDALRIPADCNEIVGAVKEPDEDPYFFCLLEDDSMITEVSVTTDNLLKPCEADETNNVQLVIKVKIRPVDFSFDNLFFVP